MGKTEDYQSQSKRGPLRYEHSSDMAVSVARLRAVDWVSGACIVLSSCLYEKLGGFDESYFLYFEDQDFCFRLKRAGAELGVDDSLRLVHAVGFESEPPLAPRLQIERLKGGVRFLAKTRPRIEALASLFVLFPFLFHLRFHPRWPQGVSLLSQLRVLAKIALEEERLV